MDNAVPVGLSDIKMSGSTSLVENMYKMLRQKRADLLTSEPRIEKKKN